MNEEAIRFFFEESRNIYYTDLFAICCQLMSIVVLVRWSLINRKLNLFLPYCVAALLLFSLRFAFALAQDGARPSSLIIEGANIVFAGIEYITFCIFFLRNQTSNFSRKSAVLILILPATAITLYVIESIWLKRPDNVLIKIADYVIAIELLILSALCVVYFVQSIINSARKNTEVNQYPITISLFIYAITIVPFFSISAEINGKIYFAFFTVNTFLLALLYLAIAYSHYKSPKDIVKELNKISSHN